MRTTTAFHFYHSHDLPSPVTLDQTVDQPVIIHCEEAGPDGAGTQSLRVFPDSWRGPPDTVYGPSLPAADHRQCFPQRSGATQPGGLCDCGV